MTNALGNLLLLPKTSRGFTAHRSSVIEQTAGYHEQLESHPHKIPRLSHDSDSGSAYRSRDLKGKAVERNGPIRIQIQFQTPPAPSLKASPNDLLLLRNCTRYLLDRTPESNMMPPTFESVYTTCCLQVRIPGQGERVYDMLEMEIKQCNVRLLRELEGKRDAGNLVDWLGQFVQVCEWFESKVGLLQSLLSYLEAAFIKKDARRLSIRELAFASFKDRILNDATMVDCIRQSIKDWLDSEREKRSAHPNRRTVQSLVSHLLLHDMYPVVFERYILEQTQSFYADEASARMEKLDCTAEQFLEYVTDRTREERERAEVVCDGIGETVKLIIQACRRGLLEMRLDWLAKGAIGPLMIAQGTERLRSIYAEFEALDSLSILCREFKSYVQTSVADIVKDTEQEDKMVERILGFKRFADQALQTSFVSASAPSSNASFAYALTDAFASGFKARRSKPAELIARHLDKLMRRGQRDISDEEWESSLEKVLALYRFTDDKDVFRTFYTRTLAKRLLLEKSASDDFEKGVLRILKEKYDPEFGQGDHMFNDLALSREILGEFHDRKPGSSSVQKLSVMVLQQSVWPFAARKIDVDLPLSMKENLQAYTDFYKVKHQGHKLEWDHSLGTATLRSIFSAGYKDLTVSLYQAVVLLLFNDETELPYKAILAVTRMDEAELKRTLQSLACANKKVLRKRPEGRDVNEDDVFYFNAGFTDPRVKVHINSIQAKDTPEESRRTQSHIDSDRKHYLDAAIVRIMKAKKELTYEELKVQTIDAVKNHFVPEVNVIKQRIVGLVEQEYLRRDDDDMNKFIYVA